MMKQGRSRLGRRRSAGARWRAACLFVVLAATTVALSGCAVNEPGATSGGLQGRLVAAGSSAQSIAQDVWVAGFQGKHGGVTIDYDPVGSGAGRGQFLAGATDFAASDAALGDEELDGEFRGCAPGSKAIDLPVYVAPLVLIFKVEGLTELNLDARTIAGIFSGSIKTWNAPEIVELNPGAQLPAAEVTAVHRSDASGTTKNFADYVHQNAPEIWSHEPSDEFPYGGEAAQGNSGVVNAVTTGRNTIGYVDASRAGSTPVASLAVGDEFVRYTPEAASAILDVSPLEPRPSSFDLVIDVDRTSTAKGVYPLVLVSYVIACEEYTDPEVSHLVKEYLGYVVSEEGQRASAERAGSAPLSAKMTALVLQSIDSIR